MSTELSIPANTGLSIFDTGTFEQMGLIASKLAASSLIPETLRTEKKNGNVVALPPEQVAANCFRIVEQSQRWGMSPFAVIDCASVVYGKLMWEGKVIAAALEATMGIRLDYDFSGQGEGRSIIVSGRFPDEEKIRQVEGNVKNWKTDQWKATDYDQRLAYRGAREWARRHAPGVILGVYSPDEIDEESLRNVTPQATRAKSKVEALPNFKTPSQEVSASESTARREEVTGEEGEAVSTPTSENPSPVTTASKERPEGKLIRATYLESHTKTGVTDGKKWTRYGFRLSLGDGEFWAGTFSRSLGSLGFPDGAEVNVIVEKRGEHYELLWIEDAEGGEEGIA